MLWVKSLDSSPKHFLSSFSPQSLLLQLNSPAELVVMFCGNYCRLSRQWTHHVSNNLLPFYKSNTYIKSHSRDIWSQCDAARIFGTNQVSSGRVVRLKPFPAIWQLGVDMWDSPLPASLGKVLDICTSLHVKQCPFFITANDNTAFIYLHPMYIFMLKKMSRSQWQWEALPWFYRMIVRPQEKLWRNQEVFFIELVVSALRLLTLFKNREGEGRLGSSHLWQLSEQSCSPVMSRQSALCFPN